MAEKFNNGDSNQSVRTKINAHADEINNNTTALAGKASKVGGLVPLAELPPVYFSGVTGSGTQQDPYVVSGAGGGMTPEQLTAYFQGLPGWAADKILQGNLEWITPPTGGNLEKLGTPTMVFGTALSDAIPVSWALVPNGVTYTLQRDTTIAFLSPVNVYVGSGTSAVDTGLTPSTQYFYRLRVSATGFASSDYNVSNKTTDVPGNVTPAAPTVTGNDTANTLTVSSSRPLSDVRVSENGGAYGALSTATGWDAGNNRINVGNVARPAGYWKFKSIASAGFNESPVSESPVFTEAALPKPNTPTSPITNDALNTFSWTNSSGYTAATAYEIELLGVLTPVTVKPFVVGDIDVPVGGIKVRVKAVSGVNQASDWLSNTVAFTATAPDLSQPITTSLVLDSVEFFNTNSLRLIPTREYGWYVSDCKLVPGTSSYVQMAVTKGVNSAHLIAGVGTDQEGENTNNYSIRVSLNTSNNNTQVGVRHPANKYDFSQPLSVVSKVRIRTQDATLYFEYFTTEWVTQATEPHNGELYVKAYFNNNVISGVTIGTEVINLRQFNLSQ